MSQTNVDDSLSVKHNPYLQSRALWNELYGSVQTKLENAYRILFVLIITIVILSIGLVIVAGRSQIKPYLTVLKDNEALTVQAFESQEGKAFTPKLAMIMAQQFIQQARSVSQDKDVDRLNRVKAFSAASGETTAVLKEHFTKLQQESDNTSTQVIMQTVLAKSKQTLNLRWLEVTRDSHSGEIITKAHYTAEITYQFNREKLSERQQQYNPLGFYITHLAWAKDLLA